MKKSLKFILLAFLGLILLAVGGLWWMSGIGQSDLESWIGSELQKAVNARGDVELKFTSIDYQAPNRIVLENLHLSRPTADGKGIDLVQVARAQIDLGGIPRRGQPIIISAVELQQPTVHVDALLKPDTRPKKPGAATRPQLSTVLKLEHVKIVNGTIDYDDGSGQQPMSWAGLNLAMDLDEHDVLWHKVHVALDQAPLVKLDLTGEINIDQVAVRSLAMALDVNLTDEKSMQFFAPRLQTLVRKFEIRGQANVRVNGQASLADPTGAAMDAQVNLTGGHVTVGEYQLPIDRLSLGAHVRDGVASLDRCDVDVIGGKVKADGTVQLTKAKQVDLQLIANTLDLQKLLRDQSNPAARQKMSGKMNAHVIARPTLDFIKLVGKPEGNGIVWASGYTRIYNGRLVNLPVIGQIISVTRRMTNLVTGGQLYRDELQANFLVVGKRLDFSDLQYFGDVVAARGRGTIGFNGDLDLVVNAGPLEGLQQYLGAVGQIWGSISDRLLAYRVGGNLKNVQIRPLIGGG